MRWQEKIHISENIQKKISRATKVIAISLVVMMYIVNFSPIVDKLWSEVGEPYDGYTYNDWYIEPGDTVVRENEVLKIYGNVVIQPGGNLSLINCELLFHHPVEGNFILHVQKNETTGICGELYLDGTTVSVINRSGGYFYDLKIEGNASIQNSDISFVGGSPSEGGIVVLGDNVSISSSKIHDNEIFGIFVCSNPIITNNEIYNNQFGIYFFNSTSEGAMIYDNEGDNGFGTYVSCMWDFNNDTFTDVVISAPYDDTVASDAGAVYLFYGSPDICLSELTPFDADIKLYGKDSGDMFGSKIDFNGDMNGDGLNDLVISAPGNNSVYVYFTNISGFGGKISNETITDFQSGNLFGMAAQQGGEKGSGQLVLIDTTSSVMWELNKSSDRVDSTDLDFWTDGVSISFPKDYSILTFDPASDYCTSYFPFDSSKNEYLGFEKTSREWSSIYYDGNDSTTPTYKTGHSDKAIYFDGVDDYLKLGITSEPLESPYLNGDGTIDFWFRNPGYCEDERSDLETNHRKMLMGLYDTNLTVPEMGIVLQNNQVHVETYTVDLEYDYIPNLVPTKVQDNRLELYIDQNEDLHFYEGIVPGADNNDEMEGSQSNVFLSPLSSFQCDGDSWMEWEIGQYYLDTTAQFNFFIRCDNIGEIAAIGIANGTGPSRNELIYYLGGTTPFAQEEMAVGNWVDDGTMTQNMQFDMFMENIYSDWASIVSTTDFGFDRIILIADKDLPPYDGLFYVDDIRFTDVYHYEDLPQGYTCMFNGSLTTSRLLSAGDIIDKDETHHVRVYFKDHYAFLELDGEVRDIEKMNETVENKFELDTDSEFYVLGQRPLTDPEGCNPPEDSYNDALPYTTFSNFHGWIDELYFYTEAIETTPLDPREGGLHSYSADIYTELLLHLDETSGMDVYNEFYYDCYDFTLTPDSFEWDTKGYFDGCLESCGMGSYIDCGNRFNLTTGTFEMYFNLQEPFSALSEDPVYLMDIKGPSNDYMSLFFDEDNGHLTFIIDHDSPHTVWSDRTSWDSNKWYHVAVTWGDGIKMYIDGVLQFDTDDSDDWSGDYESRLIIGAEYESYDYMNKFKGRFDEVRLSNIPRSDFPTLIYFRSESESLSDEDTIFLCNMNEGSGTMTVDNILSNNGDIYDAAWSDGRFGRCLSFNGSDSSYVSFTTAGFDYTIDTDISLDAWIYPTGTGHAGHNYIITRPGSYGLSLFEDGYGDIYLRGMVKQDGSEQWTDTSYSCLNFDDQFNTWYHVGLTYDNTNGIIKTFINGRLDAQKSVSSTGPILEDGAVIKVGEYFLGKIDDARISYVKRDHFNSTWSFDTDQITSIRFDEGTGLNSKNHHDSSQKAVLFDGSGYGSDWVTGHIGSAVSLDGVDDYLFVNDTNFDYDEYGMTLSLFVKMPQELTDDRYVILEKDNSFNLSIEKNYNDYCLIVYARAGSIWYSTSTPIEDVDMNDCVGRWTQVGFTFGDGVLRSFVNGRVYGFVEVPYLSFDNTGKLYIGRNDDGNYFAGAVDEFIMSRINLFSMVRYRSDVTSSILSFESPVRLISVDIPVTIPEKTNVKYQIRTGNTTSQIENGSWTGPTGPGSFYFVDLVDFTPTNIVTKYIQVKIFLESDLFDVTPTIYSVNVTGSGYHDEGSYLSSVAELPDWADQVVPQIIYSQNGRSVSFDLGWSVDGDTWYYEPMSSGTPIQFNSYYTKFFRIRINISEADYYNGAFTPSFDSIRLWYQFKATLGSIQISEADSTFGSSFTSGGDFNGDGYSDVAVGSPGENKVYIYFGGGSMDETADCVLTSAETGFGANLTQVGDYTGDGMTELAVGCDYSSSVYLYSGSRLSGSKSSDCYEDIIFGSGDFGTNVFNVGDINGDRFDDIAVFAGNSTLSVYSGQALFESNNLTYSEYFTQFTSESTTTLGYQCVGGFDINGDFVQDLIITDPDSIEAYIMLGSAVNTDPISVSSALYTFTGSGSGVGFGEAVSAGDINGDGFTEFLLGEPTAICSGGSGVVRSPGPSTARVSDNIFYGNYIGLFADGSQQSMRGDSFYLNDYIIYSSSSTLILIGVRINNETSDLTENCNIGMEVHGGNLLMYSSQVYSMDNTVINNFNGNVSLYNVSFSQSRTEYTIDYSVASIDELNENLILDGSAIKLKESGSDTIFSENWSVIDQEKWNATGTGTVSKSNNTWSGSGSDLKVTCEGTESEASYETLEYTIDFDESDQAMDYVLQTRFLLMANPENFTEGSIASISFNISRDDQNFKSRKMVFSSFDYTLLGDHPEENDWNYTGESWEKSIKTGYHWTWYHVTNTSYVDKSLDDPLLELFGQVFRENNTGWTEIDNLTIRITVLEDPTEESIGLGFDPEVYVEGITVTNSNYVPVYYTDGFLVSDVITRPTNNQWDELFVTYQDPDDLYRLNLYLLDGSNDTITKVDTLPFDLTPYNGYSELKFKASFQGNSFSTSRLTKWGISFSNINDTAVRSSNGQISMSGCSFDEDMSNQLDLDGGCQGRMIDTLTDDNKVTISDPGSFLDVYGRVQIETYPEIHPFMDPGFQHDVTPFMDFDIVNRTGVRVFNGFTGSDGVLSDILIKENTWTSNGIIFHGPFNIRSYETCMDFDGDDYIALNMSFSEKNCITQMSAFCWFKTTESGMGQNLNWAFLDFDRSEYFNIYVRGDNGNMGFSTKSDNGIDDLIGTTAVNDGDWHFMCAVYDGTDKYLYLDGDLEAIAENPHNGLGLGTTATRFGFIGDGSEATTFDGNRNEYYFKGKIDDVGYFGRALTFDEINLFMIGEPPSDPDLFISFEDSNWTSGTYTIRDLSGNSYHGTSYGNPEFRLTNEFDDQCNHGILNNASFTPGLSRTLWINSYSLDSDDDYILDSQENNENVCWYEGEDFGLTTDQIEPSWDACGEKALKPTSSGSLINKYLPVPPGSDDSIRFMFRLGPQNQVFNQTVKISVWEVDGYTADPLTINQSFILSSRFRYYTTEIFSIDPDTDMLKISIDSTDAVLLDSFVIIRSDDELDGLITNPVMMDSDKDLIIDGVEQRSGTLWFEAEYYGDGDISPFINASSGHVIYNESLSTNLISIPVQLDNGTEYRYYFRSRADQDSEWEVYDTFDDVYDFMDNWEHVGSGESDGAITIDDSGSGNAHYSVNVACMDTDISNDVYYSLREFQTNFTCLFNYTVRSETKLGRESRMIFGVVDGDDDSLRATFSIGFTETNRSNAQYNDLDFAGNQIMLISDGKEIGFYRKNYLGSYSQLGSADIRSYSSFRIFFGISAGNKNLTSPGEGVTHVWMNDVMIKEENLKLEVLDSSQSSIAVKNFSLDNKFRWNYITFEPEESGTHYLVSSRKAGVGLFADKAMVCNMSQVKQTLFGDDTGDTSILEITETDFSQDEEYGYTFPIHTSYLPGTSFATSAFFRLRTDLENIDPVDEFTSNNQYRDPSVVYGNKIAWTELVGSNYVLKVYDMVLDTTDTYNSEGKDFRHPSICGNHVVFECWDGAESVIYLVELNLTGQQFRQLNSTLEEQLNPYIYEDRIVFQARNGSDFDIYLFDIDLDNDGIPNFYEPGYLTDDDDDSYTNEDPFNYLDDDDDGDIDEDISYNGIFHVELNTSSNFIDEDWDQTYPRIEDDRIVFLDTHAGATSVWIAGVTSVKPYAGMPTEACLKVNSTSLISGDYTECWNPRISGSNLLFAAYAGFQVSSGTESRPAIGIYDLSHNQLKFVPISVAGFDVYNENIVYSTSEGSLGVYDINVNFNKILMESCSPSVPAIHKNTFCWLNDTTSNQNIVSVYSQYIEIEASSSGSGILESSKVIPLDELSSDFGPDILEYLYGKTTDQTYEMEIHTKNPLNVTLDHLEINLEFIMDPLDPDTDYDNVNDGEEIVTFGGVSILECEDAQLYKPWNPTYMTEFLSEDNELLKTTAGYGFFQQRSVSLISSNYNDTILDSSIKLQFVPDKTGTYRFSLNYPAESRQDKLVGTMIPGNLPRTELLPQGSLNVTDLDLNSSEAEYLQDILSESFQMRVYYSYNEVSPIEYSSESTYTENVNIIKVVNTSNDPNEEPIKAVIGEITSQGEYLLQGGMMYYLELSLDLADQTSETPEGVIDPDRITLQYLDYIRVDYQGLDPMNRDSDMDDIDDGDEAFNETRYALSSDPDHDGISDKWEDYFGTDFGDRDSDGDGIRDGVELGLSGQFIEYINGDVNSTGSFFERIAHSSDRSPFNFSLINNFDADNGATLTDPMDPDTDNDGLPDGWIDGWYYGDEVFPRLYRKSYDSFWDRYANLDYWEYQPWKWDRKMDPDNVKQIYEGEDLNLDGKTEPFDAVWSFDPYTFEVAGVGETNASSLDTDGDSIDDGYEVWYSHIWPYFIYRDGTVEGLDPTVDDDDKDIDGVDVLWEAGLMEGETNPETIDYDNEYDDRGTYDWQFWSSMCEGSSLNRIHGFAQRLDVKAGDLFDADYIEVKADFYSETIVEIWEGTDPDWLNTNPKTVYPERPVFQLKMPPTVSDDGWIKIPLAGNFDYLPSISMTTDVYPVYFIVLRNEFMHPNEGPGLVWHTKHTMEDPGQVLIFTDLVFQDENIPEESYDALWESVKLGTAPDEMVREMFHNFWAFYPNFQFFDAWQIKNTSSNKFCAKFGYRIVDLDKESIKMNVPYYKENWEDDKFPLIDQNELAIRLMNFTEDERFDFFEGRFYVQTDDSWSGDIYLMEGKDQPHNSLQSMDIDLPADFEGWFIFDINGLVMPESGMQYFIVISGDESMQMLNLINNDDDNSPLDYMMKNGEYAPWESVPAGTQPAFILLSNKFDSYQYGDDLSNRDEYIIGTHPKKNNTDRMIIEDDVYNDYLDDGEEIYAGGSSAYHTKGGVIYRSSFDGGSLRFEGYDNSSAWLNYDWDGFGAAITMNFTYSRMVTNPPADSPCGWDNITLLFRLKDESGVFMDESSSQLYIWDKKNVIPDSQDSESGYKILPGKVAIYNRSGTEQNMNHLPIDRNREVYFCNPFEIDSDIDGIVDGQEVQMFSDSDSDYVANLRDTDSDNDKVLDRQEINWSLNSGDDDGIENMIDPDSDNDGLLDGDEVSWNFDTDDDGYENMIDPDSDGDGLPDGWMDGMIWDPIDKEFVDYSNTFVNDGDYNGYSFVDEVNGYFDPWEGEDSNMNGKHDRDEPDPTKADTDGDSLWDGFDVYSNASVRTGLPAHYGELYYCSDSWLDDEYDDGMPFSAGDQRRIAQSKAFKTGILLQMTNQMGADSDGDGLTDYEEILIWTLKVEDFVPAYNLTSNDYNNRKIKTFFAQNLIGSKYLSSDPNDPDSDDDGLSDKDEYKFTNPLDVDTDNDGLPDKMENWHNYGMRDYDETNPCDRDTDNDGLPDGWCDGWDTEHTSAVDIIETGECEFNIADSEDGWNSYPQYTNQIEFGEYKKVGVDYTQLSDPLRADTDEDGIIDGIEYCYYWNVKGDPFYDSDGDNKFDLREIDSDNDGFTDGEENRNQNFELDYAWAIYVPGPGDNWNDNSKPTGSEWVNYPYFTEGYKVKHYLESDPTIADCDNDGLLDSVEPDPFTDTDGDGYINVWDQDSNDGEGNGPGHGPKAWTYGNLTIYTPDDNKDDSFSHNAMFYDLVDPSEWDHKDFNQTYIVFRTNANDTDEDLRIDYNDIGNNSGRWVSVDLYVNTKKNEFPGNSSISSEYSLSHSWADTGYIITNKLNYLPGGTNKIKIYYGDSTLSDPIDLKTPEGYQVYNSTWGDIYIEVSQNVIVRCVKGTGNAPSDFETSVHSNSSFARNRSETIDGRAALDMDPDSDDIPTPIEVAFGLNPKDADTDNDGLLDGEEPDWYLNSDNDNQFYAGYTNTNGYTSINALDPDSDNDGLLDGTEMGVSTVHNDSRKSVDPESGQPHDYPLFIPTNKNTFDADFGLTITDPLNRDTDFDGLSDGWNDTNQDGYHNESEPIGEDYFQNYFFLNSTYGNGKVDGDTNNDGYWQNSEVWLETSPTDADCDDDGLPDPFDENSSREKCSWYEDFDGDGLINAVDPDSDNDHLYDGLESGVKPGDARCDTDLSRPYF
ncbi:MAG: FG-GAP repeat protein, partial [Candidatus Thermoplasmatota archaeon]|nr:FG-GAP repeat protein [Candidatus Thermoplasmatota archaeon]